MMSEADFCLENTCICIYKCSTMCSLCSKQTVKECRQRREQRRIRSEYEEVLPRLLDQALRVQDLQEARRPLRTSPRTVHQDQASGWTPHPQSSPVLHQPQSLSPKKKNIKKKKKRPTKLRLTFDPIPEDDTPPTPFPWDEKEFPPLPPTPPIEWLKEDISWEAEANQI